MICVTPKGHNWRYPRAKRRFWGKRSMQRRRGWLAAVVILISASVLGQDDVHGVDVLGMNTAIRPGDDFYGYANGAWVATASIPPDSSSWGRVVELREETKHRLALILEDVSRLGQAQSRT